MADSILKRKETKTMSDIEILNQIKDLANKLTRQSGDHIREAVGNIESGWLFEPSDKDKAYWAEEEEREAFEKSHNSHCVKSSSN